jgi:hypothetical protein
MIVCVFCVCVFAQRDQSAEQTHKVVCVQETQTMGYGTVFGAEKFVFVCLCFPNAPSVRLFCTLRLVLLYDTL